MHYQPSFIIADDNTVVALRHIESINLSRQSDEKVVDNLKGDAVFTVKTVGGNVYEISSLLQKEILGKQYTLPSTPADIKSEIFQRWIAYIN
jgi:hypothetical protein